MLTSVKNALRILRSFSMEEPEKKISDLARELGISKSAVSRLMATLASEGFVTKNMETGQYRLGVSILTLSSIFIASLDLYQESLPVLKWLVEETGEAAHIAVMDGTDIVYVNKVESKHPIQILTHMGRRNPAYCTSTGKVLLAYQTEDVIEEVIHKGLEAYASNTITDPETLRRSLAKVREDGYAISISEIMDGVTSIGVPVRDYTGNVVAAVSIVGTSQHINKKTIPTFVKHVKRAGREISDRLGYWEKVPSES
jgi:DNA-binding IclR family transcriptional regulator